MAKFCFKLGINLKRIEVIADDQGEIIEATRRMSSNYDFVVTRQVFTVDGAMLRPSLS